jgi:hypothetical protein
MGVMKISWAEALETATAIASGTSRNTAGREQSERISDLQQYCCPRE